MSSQRRASQQIVLSLTLGLLVWFPACQQQPRSHPEDVNRLIRDSNPAAYPLERFTPVPEAELQAFELPEPAPYRIGIGDKLLVKVLHTTQVQGFGEGIDVQVMADGNVRLPTVGRIEAVGKTALELEDALTPPIRTNLVKDAVVSVEVTTFGSQRFFVVGQVGSPGTLPVNGKTTLMEALIASSGTNVATADLDEAYVIRDQKPIPFSIKDIMMRGHPIGRLIMEEHDIVFVPHLSDRNDYVYVFGEVNSPNRIQMDKEGPLGAKGRMSLASAMAQAGGLSTRADINSITIYRGTWKNAKRYRIGINDVYHYGDEIYLEPGDRIAVETNAATKFSDALGPGLQVIGASSSVLSLALSIIALDR